MFDRDSILKFRPVMESPVWGRLEDDIIIPMLDKLRKDLEICPLNEVESIRGQIKSLRSIIELKERGRQAIMEKV